MHAADADLWLCCGLQGFHIPGDACSSLPSTPTGRGRLLFLNNVAHSNLVGLVLRAVSDGGPCTALANFTTYLSWDFGIITLKGIASDVTLQHVVVAGMTLLAKIWPLFACGQ